MSITLWTTFSLVYLFRLTVVNFISLRNILVKFKVMYKCIKVRGPLFPLYHNEKWKDKDDYRRHPRLSVNFWFVWVHQTHYMLIKFVDALDFHAPEDSDLVRMPPWREYTHSNKEFSKSFHNWRKTGEPVLFSSRVKNRSTYYLTISEASNMNVRMCVGVCMCDREWMLYM